MLYKMLYEIMIMVIFTSYPKCRVYAVGVEQQNKDYKS